MTPSLLSQLDGRRGHFRLESGQHSNCWYDLDRLVARTDVIAPSIEQLAAALETCAPDIVCGPKTGGAVVATLLAARLRCGACPAERHDRENSAAGSPARYQLTPESASRVNGKRVVVVDDAISAGSALKGTLAALQQAGAVTVGLGALIVFGDAADILAIQLGLPLVAAERAVLGLWKPAECPLCAAGAPLTEVGAADANS